MSHVLDGQEVMVSSLIERLKTAPHPSDVDHGELILKEFLETNSSVPAHSDLVHLIETNSLLRDLTLGIFGNSSYLTALITRQPLHYYDALEANPETYMDVLGSQLKQDMQAAVDFNQTMQILRVFKQRAALFIALTDISGCWDVPKVIYGVTQIADISLAEAVNFLLQEAAKKGDYFPSTLDNLSERSGYIVLAMGKQGGFELNYSSDVDLIIFFDKERLRLKEGLDPSTFFVRFTRKLVKLMQEMTADGYVFRMDLRLRPDPGATQIALSTDAAFAYYESFGQNWERAAMIKARPVAGDIEAGLKFLKGLSPFIWRKYLDFAAIDDIHAMKRQIHSFKGHGTIAIEGHNLKLGRGGIREIEFFAQTQQLIAGGRQPELRTTGTLETLKVLTENKWIKAKARDNLTKAYVFLRRIEHRVQMIADEQTHSLPTDEIGMNRVAKFSGFATVEDFSNKLRAQLETVKTHYEDLFEDDASLSNECGNLVFVGDSPDPDTVETLNLLGFHEPVRVIETVKSWHFGRYAATRSGRARERLTDFQPLLIEALSKTSQPDFALASFDRFLKSLPAGIQLFSLLSSNPNLLRLLAEIMGTAPSLARVLGRRPRILDAVLDPGFFGDLPNDSELRCIIKDEFSQCLDYQDTLDRARIVGQDQSFLIGVRFLSGVIDAEQAASGYTRLAENIIEQLQEKVALEIEEQHGTFVGAGVSVLAMGKLGGREMTATSDLDLILLYDFEEGQIQSNGKKPLSPTQYYSRFTQRLISALSAPTGEGELYEVDMRLRPSGRSGPVATHINSFLEYQQKQAWVWEHMALTRARPITGSADFQKKICHIIGDVLSTPNDPLTLARDVCAMRQKIEQEKGTDNIWDIKQSAGGQVDLEFICQYLQLLHGHEHKEIFKGNSYECLEAISKANIIPPDMSTKLLRASKVYNSLIQMFRLCTNQDFDPNDASEGLKLKLANSINEPSFSALKGVVLEVQSDVRAIYQDLLVT